MSSTEPHRPPITHVESVAPLDDHGEQASSAPDETPTFDKRHFQRLQTRVVTGLAVIATVALVLIEVMAIIRPELADLAATMAQVILPGLICLGCTIVGYLFFRESK